MSERFLAPEKAQQLFKKKKKLTWILQLLSGRVGIHTQAFLTPKSMVFLSSRGGPQSMLGAGDTEMQERGSCLQGSQVLMEKGGT